MLKSSRRPGFTLIEILITLAIMVILASFLLYYLNPEEKLHDASTRVRVSQREELRNALVQYYTDHHTYPPGITTAEKQMCSFGVTNPNCVNLDVLVTEGFLDDLPQDELSEEPNSGYLVYLENENIVTRAEHGATIIRANIPLVVVESGTSWLEMDTSVPPATWASVLPEGKQVKLILPIDNSNLITLDTSGIVSSYPAPELENIPVNEPPFAHAQDVTSPVNGSIAVTAKGLRKCQVLPPYSFINCIPTGFPIKTPDIRTSSKFQISSTELGLSNPIKTRRWRVEHIADNEGISDSFTVVGNHLYFVAEGLGGANKLFRTDGSTVRQITNFSADDDVMIIGVLNGEVFFLALDSGSKYHIFKTNGETVTRVSNINLIGGSPGGDITNDEAAVFKGNLYFNLYTRLQGVELSQPALFRTDGKSVTQVTNPSTYRYQFVGQDSDYLYLFQQDSEPSSFVPSVLSRLSGDKIEVLVQGTHDSSGGPETIENIKTETFAVPFLFDRGSIFFVVEKRQRSASLPLFTKLMRLTDSSVDQVANSIDIIPVAAQNGLVYFLMGNVPYVNGIFCPCRFLYRADSNKIYDTAFAVSIVDGIQVIRNKLYLLREELVQADNFRQRYLAYKFENNSIEQIGGDIYKIIDVLSHPVLGETVLGRGIYYNGPMRREGFIQSDGDNNAIISHENTAEGQFYKNDFYFFRDDGLYRFSLIDK